MEEMTIETTGWEAISTALSGVYGKREPFHFGTLIRWGMGGPDPLDGISVYLNERPLRHFHYVSFGLTELYGKEGDVADVSGFGFELTFRLVVDDGIAEPPKWPMHLMQNIARYVFSTGNVFSQYDHMNAGGAFAEGSAITAFTVIQDPALPPMQTGNWRVEFLQVVGLTTDEYRLVKEWNAERFLGYLAGEAPMFVTDVRRPSLLADPTRSVEMTAAAKEEGSSQRAVCTRFLEWTMDGDTLTVQIQPVVVPDLCRLLEHCGHRSASFHLQGADRWVSFEPGQTNEWRLEGADNIIVTVSAEAALALAGTVRSELDIYRTASAPSILIEVV